MFQVPQSALGLSTSDNVDAIYTSKSKRTRAANVHAILPAIQRLRHVLIIRGGRTAPHPTARGVPICQTTRHGPRVASWLGGSDRPCPCGSPSLAVVGLSLSMAASRAPSPFTSDLLIGSDRAQNRTKAWQFQRGCASSARADTGRRSSNLVRRHCYRRRSTCRGKTTRNESCAPCREIRPLPSR